MFLKFQIYHYWIIALVALAFVLLLAFIFYILYRRKPKGIRVDQEFLDKMIFSLGGIKNIIGISVDNSRLKIELANLNIANFDELKKLASTGVFITSNTVKVLFKYDSKLIKSQLEKMM